MQRYVFMVFPFCVRDTSAWVGHVTTLTRMGPSLLAQLHECLVKAQYAAWTASVVVCVCMWPCLQ